MMMFSTIFAGQLKPEGETENMSFFSEKEEEGDHNDQILCKKSGH